MKWYCDITNIVYPVTSTRVAGSLEIFSRTFFSMRYGQCREEVWWCPGRLLDCMPSTEKSCAGPPKARGPRPWPIWPMRKSVTVKWLFPNDTPVCDITSCKQFSADHDLLRIFYEPWARNVAISCSESNGNTGDHDRGRLWQVWIMVHVWRVTYNITGKK